MRDLPRITVITPSYNCVKSIGGTIKSVVEQTYSNLEYIIVDGGSDDGTVGIIKEFAKEYAGIIKYISEKDNGIYDAMNKGTKMATGEWVYFLGGDDYLYEKDVLKKIFAQESTSDFNLIYGNVKHGNGAVGSGEVSRKGLLGMNIPHQAIFYRRSKVLEWGGYELKYKIMADKLLNLQMFSEDIGKIKYINLIVAFFSNEGLSSKNFDKGLIGDMDKIAIQYYSTIFSKGEIYEAIRYYSFQNIKRFNVLKGIIWILRTGSIDKYWRDIIYCLLFRFGFKKEN